MAGFKCPYCKEIIHANDNTSKTFAVSFDELFYGSTVEANWAMLTVRKCSNDACLRHSLHIAGTRKGDFSGLDMSWPPNSFNQYPAFVPEQIRQDYQEACAIRVLSPKASATMSRRCLQGMIRDFHGISKESLHQEITALTGKVDDEVIKALLSAKSIANIGAHPEQDINLILDIDPGEAETLTALVELLIDEWYVARDRRSKLLKDTRDIFAHKEAERQHET